MSDAWYCRDLEVGGRARGTVRGDGRGWVQAGMMGVAGVKPYSRPRLAVAGMGVNDDAGDVAFDELEGGTSMEFVKLSTARQE